MPSHLKYQKEIEDDLTQLLYLPPQIKYAQKTNQMTNENYIGAPLDASKVSELRFNASPRLSSQADSFDTFISQSLKDVKSFVRTDADDEWTNFLKMTA